MPTYKAYLKTNTKKKTSITADTEIYAYIIACEILKTRCDADILLIQETPLSCPKCSYKWNFGGFRRLYATCPQCMKQILISEASK